MKAVRLFEFGGPDKLVYGDYPMPIHAVLPLSKAAEAHAMLENDEDVVGRIVLHPWDD